MNSPLPDVDRYWRDLSASIPAVQPLEGQGTAPQFDVAEPKGPAVSVPTPRFRSDFNI